VGWLRAASIIAGVPFQSAGLTDSGEDLAVPPPFEAGVNHLSDHDWVLSDPGAAATEAALSRLGRAALGDKATAARLRWMSHRIQSRVSGMKLYSTWLAGGDEAVRRELQLRDVPLVDAADGE
jgi:hypothetical protein